MTETQSTLSRRTFVKGSLAGLAATGAAGTALYGCAPQTQAGTGAGEEPMPATGEEAAPDEIHWSQCNVNCGGNCVFQWHSRDGKVLYMETDDAGDTDLAGPRLPARPLHATLAQQPRPPAVPHEARGQARRRASSSRSTWDEAIDTIASEAEVRVIDTYGNDAIHRQRMPQACTPPRATPPPDCSTCLGGYLEPFTTTTRPT